MRTRSLIARIERAEQAAKAQSKFSPECICFPENEKPSFVFPVLEDMAIRLLCPLHGCEFRKVTKFMLRRGCEKSCRTYCGRIAAPNSGEPGSPHFRKVCGRR
jgi:hypothetical protein